MAHGISCKLDQEILENLPMCCKVLVLQVSLRFVMLAKVLTASCYPVILGSMGDLPGPREMITQQERWSSLFLKAWL